MKKTQTPDLSGYSLVELLVVMAILGVLATLVAPSVSNIQRAMNLNNAGQMLADSLVSARQEASGKNRNVELRLIELSDPDGYRALQTWIADDKGLMSPLGKVLTLPEGSLIASDPALSPLLTATPTLSGSFDFGAHGNRPYAVTRFRAGGLPDPSINQTNNFLTVRAVTDTAIPPLNYYTVRLDPVTGRLAVHRP